MNAAPHLTPDELLTTTRAVRWRLDFDRPVELDVVRECLEIALQAPSGSNAQGWHWMLVTDADQRGRLAELYRSAFADYRGSSAYAGRMFSGDEQRAEVQQRVSRSADYLAEHLHRVPVLVVPCIRVPGGRLPDGSQASLWGSLLPAVWNFMLAARTRGLGTSWTTLHLKYEEQGAEILGIPDGIRQGALIPTAYSVGTDFKPAPRVPLGEVLHVDRW